MKHLFPLLLAAALVSCGHAYTIQGISSEADGTPVYLIDLQAKDTLAQTALSAGTFRFSGRIGQPAYVYVGHDRIRIRFILEGGTVTADLDERTASGTPLVETYNQYHRRYYGFKGPDKALRQADAADSMASAHPDDLLGALAMPDLANRDTARFLARYRQMSPQVQQFYQVKEAWDNVQLLKKTAEGQMFTDYLVPGGNPDGSDVRLSDYVGRGKYVLLDHWASWCGPCKAEMPYLRAVWEEFSGEQFQLVSIAVSDKREDTEAALEKLALPWPQILDGKKIPLQLYGVNAIPHLILFAPDGTIVRRGLRGEETREVLSGLLKH